MSPEREDLPAPPLPRRVVDHTVTERQARPAAVGLHADYPLAKLSVFRARLSERDRRRNALIAPSRDLNTDT